jgi:hypothetical protein
MEQVIAADPVVVAHRAATLIFKVEKDINKAVVPAA